MRNALMSYLRSRLRRAAFIAPLAFLLAACSQAASQGQSSKAPPPQVTVAKPVSRTVAEHKEFVGRFVAVDAVEIRARVSGYLDKIAFRDGQRVKKGDLLFTIDQRPFETILTQAKAQLEQARANLAFAQSNLERGQRLKRGTDITEQTYDQRVQAERVAKAAVLAQEAAVKQAELDLQFTQLTAPVAGRIGDRRVSPGNLVTGGNGSSTTLLATIQSIDPIRFEFTLDEASYLEFVRTHGEHAISDLKVPVRLKLIGEDTFRHEGQLDFIDNAINTSNGVIRFRAELANPNGTLTPGMFGRVRMQMAAPAEVLMVPDEAIGSQLANKVVMTVVTKDGKSVAEPKYVKLGPVIDGLRVVRSGLDKTDVVIISGLMRARPGAPVTPKEGTIATAENSVNAAGAANADHRQ